MMQFFWKLRFTFDFLCKWFIGSNSAEPWRNLWETLLRHAFTYNTILHHFMQELNLFYFQNIFKDRNVHFRFFFHYSFDLPNSSDISLSESFTSMCFTNFTANCCGLNTQESVLDSLEFVDTTASERTPILPSGYFVKADRGFPKLNCMDWPLFKNKPFELFCFVIAANVGQSYQRVKFTT